MILEECRAPGRTVGAGLRSIGALALIVVLELLALEATRGAWRGVRQPGPASFDEAVVLVVLAACALIGAWLVVVTAIALAAHLPGRCGETSRRWAHAWAPAAVRRIAAVLVGAAIGGSLVSGTAVGEGAVPERVPGFVVTLHPGAATVAPPPVAAPAVAPPPAVPAPVAAGPGWTPSRPAGAAAPVTRLVTSGSVPHASDVVVRRGDTLWDLARRHLGPGASDAEVAAAWPHWYAANRHVIGPDPDLLLPGQVLRAPESSRSADHATGARP